MTYTESVQDLLHLPRFTQAPTFERIAYLLDQLGHPEKNLSIIHIAGTNGKGSVSSLLNAIYQENGLRVGLFTSPHLMEVTERIQINNIEIDQVQFASYYTQIQDISETMAIGPTFFERLCAMAFLYFHQEQVDLVLLEAGIGGKWDTTNIIEAPIASIITHIGLDHTEILGNSIEAITNEKLGIVKKDVPLILCNAPELFIENAAQIKCQEQFAPLHFLYPFHYEISEITDKSIAFSIQNKYYEYNYLQLFSKATYQIENVALALTAVAVLEPKYPISQSEIRSGLQKFYWPGRMELVTDNIILDGAHNALGVHECVTTLRNLYSQQQITLLIAIKSGKDFVQMCDQLAGLSNVKKMILCQMTSCDSVNPKEIAGLLSQITPVPIEIMTDFKETLETFLAQQENKEQICCCLGSLYFIGEIKQFLNTRL